MYHLLRSLQKQYRKGKRNEKEIIVGIAGNTGGNTGDGSLSRQIEFNAPIRGRFSD